MNPSIAVILDEWEMKEIRARVQATPWRYEQLVRTGGRFIKSALILIEMVILICG